VRFSKSECLYAFYALSAGMRCIDKPIHNRDNEDLLEILEILEVEKLKTHSFTTIFLTVVICGAIFAIVKAQLTPANPHKAIDDYMRSYERLIEQVETLDTRSEQNLAYFEQSSKQFAVTAERLQSNTVWTKNDTAMLSILNSRYSAAVSRLISGNMSQGIALSFKHFQ